MNLLDLVPKWVWAAIVAALAATSCKLKWDNTGLSLEIEKHATTIAQLETSISRGNEQAAAQASLFTQQARTAEQARAVREKALLADAASAKSELERLRVAVSSKAGMYGLRSPSSSFTPELDAPNPFPELFLQCSERYGEVARAADDHANDAKTLIEAWPQNKPKE